MNHPLVTLRRSTEQQQQHQQRPARFYDDHEGTQQNPYFVTGYLSLPCPDNTSRFAITKLPPELIFIIFDKLDRIDSTCLGLSSKHLYAIYRRDHDTVPLSCRRIGPNKLEWVWYNISQLRQKRDKAALRTRFPNTDDITLIDDLIFCRFCGVCRCELHRHLSSWMEASQGYPEYCSVSEKFGPPACNEASKFCYLRNPRSLCICGRHSLGRSWGAKVEANSH